MKTRCLKTIDQDTLTDLMHDIVTYLDPDATDEQKDEVHGMIIDALGINNNHDGIGLFKANIIDTYDTYRKDDDRLMIYCSDASDGYDFEDWFNDVDPHDPQHNSSLEEMYYRDIEEMNDCNWDDITYCISKILKEYPIVMSGTEANWYGIHPAGHIFTDFDEFIKVLYPGPSSTVKFYLTKDGDMYRTMTSHDCPTGGGTLHFRIMTDEGVKKWMDMDSDNQSNRGLIEEFFDSNTLTRPFTEDDL